MRWMLTKLMPFFLVFVESGDVKLPKYYLNLSYFPKICAHPLLLPCTGMWGITVVITDHIKIIIIISHLLFTRPQSIDISNSLQHEFTIEARACDKAVRSI